MKDLKEIAKDFKEYAKEDGQSIRAFVNLFEAIYHECKDDFMPEEGEWKNANEFYEDMHHVISLCEQFRESNKEA